MDKALKRSQTIQGGFGGIFLSKGFSIENIRSTIRKVTIYALTSIYILCIFTFPGGGNTTSLPATDASEQAAVAVFSDIDIQNKGLLAADSTSEKSSIYINNNMSNENKLLPLDEINYNFEQYGSMTIAGMKPEDYDKALSGNWEILNTTGDPIDYMIDLNELMDYSAIEKYILNMDKYEGVEVSVIGESEQNRNIYMVKLDYGNNDETIVDKPVIMITGGIHAREFAGTEYSIKFLNDTIIKANHDEYTRLLLQNITIVAVPLINPDGRELIINGGDPDRKSNANGVDLNRSMPSINAGQLVNGITLYDNFSCFPDLYYFAGYNLGSESETQTMIKWFNYYVPTADLYIDLHQQGGLVYYNKDFLSAESDLLSEEYAKKNNRLLKGGYPLHYESEDYGLNGDGGTFTDYARSLAEGLKFNYSLGRMVLDADGIDMPLICFKDIDEAKEYYNPINSEFKSICIEIGRNPKYLGTSAKALKLRKWEYQKYGWNNFLTSTIENILGKEKVNSLKHEVS